MKPSDPDWPQPSSAAVSSVMRGNRWRDTSPEVAVRSILQSRGRRFRKRHTIRLGDRRWTQPDAVFTRARVVLFIDGCFWHRCPEHGTEPGANTAYWGPKLDRNVARDRDTDARLTTMGWMVVRAWEHEDPVEIADRLEAVLDTRLVVAGVAAGMFLLTRPSAQVVVIALAIVIIWRFGWRRAAQWALATLVVVTPWLVRNWAQIGAPVLVTSNGFNLAATYSPEARSTGDFVDPVFDPRFERFRLAQFDEARWDREPRSYALESLRRDPLQIFDVVRRNTVAYFEVRPSRNRGAEGLDGRNWVFRSATLPLFYVVTVAGAAGLWHYRTRLGPILLVVVAATSALSSLVLVSAPRLRAPLDLVAYIGAALFVLRRWDRAKAPDAAHHSTGGRSPSGSSGPSASGSTSMPPSTANQKPPRFGIVACRSAPARVATTRRMPWCVTMTSTPSPT